MGLINSLQNQISSCFEEQSSQTSKLNFTVIQQDQRYIQNEQWCRMRNTPHFDYNKLLFMYPEYATDQKIMDSYWQRIKFGESQTARDINDVILPQYKYVIRKGVPFCKMRGYLIDVLKLSQQSASKKQQYNKGLIEAFKGKIPDQFTYVPLFGNQGQNLIQTLRVYYLTPQGIKTLSQVLWVIHKSKHIQYCPTIVHVASIMILFLQPWQLYFGLMFMIEDSINLHQKNQDSLRWHFSLTQNQISRLSKSFFQTISSTSRTFQSIVQHLYSYDIDQQRLFKQLTIDLFLKCLPFPNILFIYQLRSQNILSSGLCFVKIIQGRLLLKQQQILKCQSLQKILSVICQRSVSLSRLEINSMMKLGFRLALPGPYRNLNTYQDSGTAGSFNQTYYFPTLLGESQFLKSQHFEIIWSFLPIMYKHDDPKLVFPTQKFGYSLSGILQSLKPYQKRPVLLIIKDSTNYIFGCFFTQNLTNNIDLSLSSSSDTFVFRLQPSISSFKSTGYNTLYCRLEQSNIFFGSGKQGPALQIQKDLWKGYSNRSQTFGNEKLSGGTQNSFKIDLLQVFVLQ